MNSNTIANQPTGSASGVSREQREPSSSSSNSTENRDTQQDKATQAKSHNKQGKQDSKPRSARFWAKAGESWKALVRALSLSLLVHAFRGIKHPHRTGRGLHEPTKIAIRNSRLIALLRALVHLVPFGFALFEIILNWNIYYIGARAYTTAVYQIIAKAHEILIQASIAAIVLSAIRKELALGEGLPFGLLFSGLQVSQISYLWSVELWGAIRAEYPRPLRKAALITLVAAGIILAVTSGPASAVLLIPRVQLWPGGRTHIWINATADQIWPSQIDGASVPQMCSTVGAEASNSCPASEWYAIRDWFSALNQTPPYSYAKKYDLGADPLLSCPVHGQYSARNLLWSERPYSAGSAPLPGYATTQQAVIGDALTDAGVLWFASLINVTAEAGHGSPLSDQSDAAHTIFSNYSQPYTTAVCVHGQVQDGTESKHVTFPLITGVNPPAMATFNTTSSTRHGPEPQQWITHPDFTYSQILDIPADANSYRLRWIPLPGDFFIGSSIGAAVRLPGPDSRTDMLVCNLAASWGPSSIVVEIRGGGIGPMGSAFHTPGNDKKPGIPISQSHIPSAEDYDAPSATPFDNGYLSSRHGQKSINISDSWAQYLDPMIEPLNSSVFDVLMHYTMGNVAGTAQNALVMLVTNGLARTAWGSTLQGDVKTVVSHGEERLDGNYWLSGKGDVFKVDPTLSQDWVTLRVDSTLKGYAYNTLTTPPRIAIALLTAYCLLVVGHTLYSAISGISSNSWDTIAEVVALAINSTPTAALRNTCAGISELYIFKLPVRVLVSKDEEGEGEHLELVLGKVDEEKIRERTIVANRTYGTLPKGVVVDEARKDI